MAVLVAAYCFTKCFPAFIAVALTEEAVNYSSYRVINCSSSGANNCSNSAADFVINCSQFRVVNNCSNSAADFVLNCSQFRVVNCSSKGAVNYYSSWADFAINYSTSSQDPTIVILVIPIKVQAKCQVID